MSDFRKIPCVIQRGGTSKGVYLRAKDVPAGREKRTELILAIFGSPDIRQIDGLGGADPLTSKCAIVGPSERPDADVDYTMAQVGITDALIDWGGNCGNISSGVGPFAIDEGMVEVHEPETVVRIFNTNTRKILRAYVATEGGKAKYLGDYAIDGVPGTGSKILLDYSATGGTVNGKILPTGNPVDKVSVEGIGELEVSVVDAGNPTCFLRPEVLGFSGIEGPHDDKVLKALGKIELIRGTVSKLMGLATDAAKARTESPTRPMIAFVCPPEAYTSFSSGARVEKGEIDFVSRLFFMQTMHKTYPGTGTVCTGVAALIDGTIVNQVCSPTAFATKVVRIGHPSGTVSIEVDVAKTPQGPALKLAAFGRTSRRIMEGFVYVPEKLFTEK
ncbi:MAG TPA: PrpF domain-containing protein [Syntrophorhabdales bacterium]|nr:PrpF domain-containing protein [Syntrophorhabdales bacterium]